MEDNIGIFQVISNCDFQQNRVVGTAFAIKTFENSNKYYLLTAYHVISELEAKGHEILIQDENGNFYNAIKIFPPVLSRQYREFGQDYALLEMYSDVKYRTYEIATVDKMWDCFVKGAIPHYCTIFTSIDGKILGLERIAYEKKVLQIRLNTSLIFDEQNRFIPEQMILRGLSGAPVFVEMQEELVCVGVLGNLERDCSGSIKYAVPMQTIIKECLEHLSITYRLYNEKSIANISFHEEALIELAIGDTEDFFFSEEALDYGAWDRLSNLFYKGLSVDVFLGNVIKSDIFFNYSAEVRCAILYYYARLLFKRGKNILAFSVFQDISEMLSVVSFDTKTKLKALIESRSAIERKIDVPRETLKAIRYAGDKVSSLSKVSNGYIISELASVYGRGLTNIFSVVNDYSYQEKEDIYKLYINHKQFLEANPIKLCKQDVVSTSLQWYIGFWEINKGIDLSSLDVAIHNGFFQSKKRKNSIFYIQSMISYGIFSYMINKKIQAVKLLLLSIKLIYKEKIQFNHEGIKQLLLIIKERYLSLYAIVDLAYKTQLSKQFYDKIFLYQIDFNITSWSSVIDQVNELYIIKFKNCKQIFNIDIEDVNIFL